MAYEFGAIRRLKKTCLCFIQNGQISVAQLIRCLLSHLEAASKHSVLDSLPRDLWCAQFQISIHVEPFESTRCILRGHNTRTQLNLWCINRRHESLTGGKVGRRRPNRIYLVVRTQLASLRKVDADSPLRRSLRPCGQLDFLEHLCAQGAGEADFNRVK